MKCCVAVVSVIHCWFGLQCVCTGTLVEMTVVGAQLFSLRDSSSGIDRWSELEQSLSSEPSWMLAAFLLVKHLKVRHTGRCSRGTQMSE